jgi:carbonic anhydrase
MQANQSASRRGVLTALIGAGLSAGAVAGPLVGCSRADAGLVHAASAAATTPIAGPAPRSGEWPAMPATTRHILDGLLAGNRRFRTGHSRHPNQSVPRMVSLAAAQHPVASFLGCVDSRVPNEIVTDSGLGDLFTARTAGHVLDAATIGSLEFGVEELKISLLVVLGHESCGAVKAAISALDGSGHAPGSIQALVDGLRPAVLAARSVADPVQRIDATVRQHTLLTVQRLVDESEIIATAVREGHLAVVGARYDLDSGAITPA